MGEGAPCKQDSMVRESGNKTMELRWQGVKCQYLDALSAARHSLLQWCQNAKGGCVWDNSIHSSPTNSVEYIAPLPEVGEGGVAPSSLNPSLPNRTSETADNSK